MKKQVKGIIGLGAVLVVLGGGLAVMKLTEPKDNSESSASLSDISLTSAVGQGIILIEDSDKLPVPLSEAPDPNDENPVQALRGTVKSLDVVNETDTLHIIMTDPPTETIAAKYTLDGCENLPLDNALVATLINNINGLTAASVIEENCENLAKFGLDDPVISAELTYESGNVKKFYAGIVNPANKGETYFRVEGSDTVYTVANSKINNYYKPVKDFIKKTILEEPAEADYPVVKSLIVERKDIDYDIVLEYGKTSDDSNAGGTSATHEMVEPISAYLTVEKSTDITNGMFGLTASEIHAFNCTDEDIAAVGLDDPFCNVTMSCDDGNEYVLLLSDIITDEEDDSRYCYAMLKGTDIIYKVSPDNAKWVTVMPIDIASRIMIANFVWNIDELSLECNTGESAEFRIDPIDPNKARPDSRTEDFVVDYNGKNIDAERYRQLYAYLISANAEDFAIDVPVPSEKPMVSLKYHDSYLDQTYAIDFYDYSAMTVLITVDGESKFFGSKSYVKNLIENIKKLETGEEFIKTWK